MGSYLVRLSDGPRSVVLVWSTIVDAAVAVLSDEDLAVEPSQRRARLASKGTSSFMAESAVDVVWLNRAGPRESQLSMRGLVLAYVHGWPAERLWPFVVPEGDNVDSFERWQEHDIRRRASGGRWPCPRVVSEELGWT